MKHTNTFKAAGILLLAAFLLTPANAFAFQKTSEADKQAQRGAEYLSRKDWNRAAESYQKALRADARHVEANYGLGLAYMNLRRADEALAAFANVIAAQPNPRAREALVSTGAVHFALQQYKEAADALEQATALGDIGPTGHYFLGKAYLQSGRDDKALDSLRRATGDPQYGPDANLSVGLVLLKQNRARDAVAPLEQAVRAGAQPAAVAQMLLGNAYLAADRPEDALTALRGADPNQFYTQLGLGFAHSALYHEEEAVAALNAAQRLQPTAPEAFIGLGNVYTRMLRYREADDAFARALALKSDSAEALMGRAVLHYYQGQYPLLVETARRAAQVAPQNAGAQTLLGAALATTGDMAGGLRAAREAARLEPENYWPHHVLGFILVRQDKASEALTEARAAARIKPNEAATQNLARLRPQPVGSARGGFAGGAGRAPQQARAGRRGLGALQHRDGAGEARPRRRGARRLRRGHPRVQPARPHARPRRPLPDGQRLPAARTGPGRGQGVPAGYQGPPGLPAGALQPRRRTLRRRQPQGRAGRVQRPAPPRPRPRRQTPGRHLGQAGEEVGGSSRQLRRENSNEKRGRRVINLAAPAYFDRFPFLLTAICLLPTAPVSPLKPSPQSCYHLLSPHTRQQGASAAYSSPVKNMEATRTLSTACGSRAPGPLRVLTDE